MLKLRQTGLRLSSQAALKTSQTPDGIWVAWLEVGEVPLKDKHGKPRLFEGHSRYQAQCAAYRWYYPEAKEA